MPVNLSIKNTPDAVVAALRARAQRNHRSLQGELMAIVEAASREPAPVGLDVLLARARGRGVPSPSEAAAIIREDRDGR